MNDFTIVCGVDPRYINQLALVWPTWVRHKPSLMRRKWVIFYDRDHPLEMDIRQIVGDSAELVCYPWPWEGVTYEGDVNDRWSHPQRYKMLAGFIHVPAMTVTTPYWLKLDVDIVASGMDEWVNPSWIDPDNGPSIAAPPWAYTKPADQMVKLDQWVEAHKQLIPELSQRPPLNLIPEPGASLVYHKKPRRICSWCAFFSKDLTCLAADAANNTVGRFQVPVPSQDGYLWYVARRMQLPIVTVKMKDFGWKLCSSMNKIQNEVAEAMKC